MYLSKKGVSPLVATILLISFAVALGAVVMNWANSIAPDSACDQAQFSITQLGGENQLCYDATTQQIRIEVRSQVLDLDGIKFTVVGSEGVAQSQVIKPVKSQEATSLIMAYIVEEYGRPDSVTLQPILDGGEVCVQQSLETKTIPNC